MSRVAAALGWSLARQFVADGRAVIGIIAIRAKDFSGA